MVALTFLQKRAVEEAFFMSEGYVLNFSDRTFAEFFGGEFGIDIYDAKYSGHGKSKAKHLRAFIAVENETKVAQVLRRLWEYRDTVPYYRSEERRDHQRERLFKALGELERGKSVAATDAIDRFISDETLDELVATIERDIAANKPVAALDRLHTYCMKKFAHLLDERKIEWQRSEPLHSRVGKYVKALRAERELRDATLQIVRNSIGMLEKFNDIRNNESLAHDNELIDPAEAQFIYDSVHALLRFLKMLEAGRFGA